MLNTWKLEKLKISNSQYKVHDPGEGTTGKSVAMQGEDTRAPWHRGTPGI